MINPLESSLLRCKSSNHLRMSSNHNRGDFFGKCILKLTRLFPNDLKEK